MSEKKDEEQKSDVKEEFKKFIGEQGRGPGPGPKSFFNLRTIFIIGMFLVGFFLLTSLCGRSGKEQSPYISYSQFWKLVDEEKVREVVVRGLEITATLKVEYQNKGSVVAVIIPEDSQYDIAEKLRKAGVDVFAAKESGGGFLVSFFSFLPLIIFVLIFIFLFRKMGQGMGGGMQKFTEAKKANLKKERPRITFEDVAGCDEAKEELKEMIDFLRNPEKFVRLGANIPKGVLLMGAPGTGKTLLARAVAGEAHVPFFSISGSEFVEMFVGVGAARVRSLFEQGRKSAPCIIFIDEIDAVGRQRGAGMGGGNDEREQTLNQILAEMDGFDSRAGILIVAATNRPDVLDPAFLRPGRFDRKVVVPAPDMEGRRAIFKVHLREKTHNINEAGIKKVAIATPGATGADIENYVNEAALFAARSNKEYIEVEDIEKAIEKIEMGPERKRIISDKEKKTIAAHEAGHALVAELLEYANKVRKVSIIPRGMSEGATWTMPDEDKVLLYETQCHDELAVKVAGRVAEEMIMKVISAGACGDIESATEIARKMVTAWGMSKKLGMVALGKPREHPFLGMEMGERKNVSEATAQLIDEEIKRFVGDAYNTATRKLRQYIRALEALTNALFEKETLTGEEVREIIRENPPEEI